MEYDDYFENDREYFIRRVCPRDILAPQTQSAALSHPIFSFSYCTLIDERYLRLRLICRDVEREVFCATCRVIFARRSYRGPRYSVLRKFINRFAVTHARVLNSFISIFHRFCRANIRELRVISGVSKHADIYVSPIVLYDAHYTSSLGGDRCMRRSPVDDVSSANKLKVFVSTN